MKTVNRNFRKLSRLGSKQSNLNKTMRTVDTTEIGVSVAQPGYKKATTLEIVVPTKRSFAGSRRVSRIVLNGHQMRELYETLHFAYATGVVNNR